MWRILFLTGMMVFVSPLSRAQQPTTIPDLTVENLLQRIEKASDTIFVVNFWATWCQPCVEEIPEFNKIQPTHHQKPVKVIMASLDFPNQKISRLNPFVSEHPVLNPVYLLIQPRGGDWITRIAPEWSGAIPATLVIHGQERLFHEGELTYHEITALLNRITTP